MTPEYIIGIWVQRILYSITFIILASIFKKEYVKLKKENTENPVRKEQQKWLDIWSFATLALLACISPFWVMNKIPTVCMYHIYNIGATLYSSCGMTLGFYQISRLQYSFSTKQSKTYGYKQWVFITLYINGILLEAYFIFANPMVQFPKSEGIYGCVVQERMELYHYFYFGYLWYYIWDVTILLLYIFKVVQIQRNNEYIKDKNISNKIKFILLKIVILTLIWELVGFIALAIHFTTVDSSYNGILHPVLWSVDYFISMYLVILMMEHNHDRYLRFVSVLNTFRLFCCCQKLVDDSIGEGNTVTVYTIDMKDGKDVKKKRKESSAQTAVSAPIPDRMKSFNQLSITEVEV